MYKDSFYYSDFLKEEGAEMTEETSVVTNDYDDDQMPTRQGYDLLDSLHYDVSQSNQSPQKVCQDDSPSPENVAMEDPMTQKTQEDEWGNRHLVEETKMWEDSLEQYIDSIADSDDISPYSLPLPLELPKVLEVSNSILPEQYRPANVLALLPILGMLATGERHRPLQGGNHLDSLSLNTCIVGEFASGKGFIEQTKEPILRETINEDREKTRKENENRRRARRGMQVEDYQCDIRIAPTDVSKKAIYNQLAANNGKHILICGAEVDELVRGQQATWSYLRAISKEAFDNADGGSTHTSVDSNYGSFPIYLNMLVEGTFYPVTQYFGWNAAQANDGMPSRWCFAILPQADPYGDRPMYGCYTDEEIEYLQSVAHNLTEINGEYTCDYLKDALKKWERTRKEWARGALEENFARLIPRAAIIGQRAGQLFACCEGIHDVDYSKCSTDEKRSFRHSQFLVTEIAVYVAEMTLRSQYYMFGDKIASRQPKVTAVKRPKCHDDVRALLPVVFDKEQFIAAYRQVYPNNHKEYSKIQDTLSKWCTKGLCRKIDKDRWEKIVPEEIEATKKKFATNDSMM